MFTLQLREWQWSKLLNRESLGVYPSWMPEVFSLTSGKERQSDSPSRLRLACSRLSVSGGLKKRAGDEWGLIPLFARSLRSSSLTESLNRLGFATQFPQRENKPLVPSVLGVLVFLHIFTSIQTSRSESTVSFPKSSLWSSLPLLYQAFFPEFKYRETHLQLLYFRCICTRFARYLLNQERTDMNILSSLIEGGIGVFGFADLANFWFGFSVFALKNRGFSVLVSRAVCGFSPI